MAEQRLSVSTGVELCLETFGAPRDPALLLIMGLGTQMIWWDETFCADLAGEGLFVIRYDNRDVGRSSVMRGRPELTAVAGGDTRTLPYSLEEMAGDAVALLDALEIERAHLCGVSMGGMIAQLVALDHPERVLSLTSIMSTTGDRTVGAPTAAAMEVLMSPPASSLEEHVEASVRAAAVIGSPAHHDPERIRARAWRSYERGLHPEGTLRQLAAIAAAPDRTPRLRELGVPTLVIHGEADPLIDVSGGRATAEAIPGAELMIVPGIGHDLPPALFGEIVRAIGALALSAAR